MANEAAFSGAAPPSTHTRAPSRVTVRPNALSMRSV
jgi:hypothetical protein